MAFTIIDCEQRTPVWHQARSGRVTSTAAADMLSVLKSGGGETAGRRNLRMRLALERITGKPQEPDFVSAAMQQGIEREADAIAAFEAMTGELVGRVGFLAHTDLLAGASLDGYIGDTMAPDVIVEAKSPIPATHWEYLSTGKVPLHYYRQAVHSLWLTGAQACLWFSFQPDFPDPLRVKFVRIDRDETEMATYELQLVRFLREVDDLYQQMANLAKAQQEG